jgi:hypothetical protein
MGGKKEISPLKKDPETEGLPTSMSIRKMACEHCGSKKWTKAQYIEDDQRILQCSECHEWNEKTKSFKPKAIS